MDETNTINQHLAWFEFRWLSGIGMFAFLIAAAAGSPIIVIAGLMMWIGFGVLAQRFRGDLQPDKQCQRAASDDRKLAAMRGRLERNPISVDRSTSASQKT